MGLEERPSRVPGGRPSPCSWLSGVRVAGGPQTKSAGTRAIPTWGDPTHRPTSSWAPGRWCPTPCLCSACSYVKRMKEFERERRLLQRKKRREQREADMAKGLGPGEVAPEVAL